MSNDVLVAQKTESGCKATVYDGDSLEFAKQNKAIKNRQEAQRAAEQKRKAEEAAKAQKEFEEYERRKRRNCMVAAVVLSTAALISCVAFDLMHHVLGMIFTAGTAAAIGYHAK